MNLIVIKKKKKKFYMLVWGDWVLHFNLLVRSNVEDTEMMCFEVWAGKCRLICLSGCSPKPQMFITIMSIRYFDAWLRAVWPCCNRRDVHRSLLPLIQSCERSVCLKIGARHVLDILLMPQCLFLKWTIKTCVIYCVKSFKSANLYNLMLL